MYNTINIVTIFLLMLLAACSPSRDVSSPEPVPEQEEDLIDPHLKSIRPRKNSVLLLLPISGHNEAIGKGILNACLLATNDSRSIDFHVVDTADTLMEKHALYDRFKNKHLRAIIGPVFSQKTKQYGALFSPAPVLSFSNNLSINGNHVFACGLSPQDEIRALFAYAHRRNINSFLIILPNGELGDQIMNVINSELKKYDLEEGDDFEIIRYADISRKAATKYAKSSNKKALFIINPILNISALEDTTVFTLSSVALSNENAWEGAVFAFADNEEQRNFIRKYQQTFGTRPTTLDMIGYDLMKIVKNSINSEKPIVNNNYEGCLGEFSVNAKSGLIRKLQVFRLEKSEKVNLTETEAI